MSDGKALLSSVLTVGQSAWATGVYGHDPADFRMRATVAGGVLRLQVSADRLRWWRLARLSPFPRAAGPLCCTPKRSGLKVRFSDFRAGPPLNKELQDMS
jgi:uncharacterized protein